MFPSFTGKDTRDDFPSHLYDAVYKRVETFIANELERGEEITAVLLLRTIEESRTLVINSEKAMNLLYGVWMNW